MEQIIQVLSNAAGIQIGRDHESGWPALPVSRRIKRRPPICGSFDVNTPAKHIEPQ